MADSTLGEQELALLRHVLEAGSATVGEVAETFGRERDLSRTTCLTMMERLRSKRRLTRRKVAGIYRYSSAQSQSELLGGVVRRFVERSLDGSVSPFVQYLTESGNVTPDELEDLESLVRKLRAERGRR
jgi:predicted transcriptional regulator